MTPDRIAFERSLALHREVARAVEADGRVVVAARARVEAWRAKGVPAAPWVDAWAALLAGGPAEIARAITDESEAMHELRQVSPFAGALSARERWAILRAVGAGAR